MTKLKAPLIIVLLLLFGPSSSPALDAKSPPPDFELKSYDGDPVSLSDFQDQTVVLEWFSSGCEFTWSHYRNGHMSGLQKEYTARGVVWLTIDVDREVLSEEEMRERAEKWVMNSTAVLPDPTGSVGLRYGATVTPQIFVIHQGRIVYQGAADDRRSIFGLLNDRATANNYIRQALDEVLSGEPVSMPETKPYGCAIKYAEQ